MTKHQALQEDLAPSEQLLWTEEPAGTAFLNGEALFFIVFFAFWLLMGVTVFENKGGIENPGSWFFLLIALWVSGASVWQVFKSVFTLYGITAKRLIIVRHYPWNTEIESYYSADIDFIRKTRKRSGKGKIVFTTVPHTGSKGRTRYEDVGFFGLDDVDSVEALILKTFRPT